jgi:hypothetical protein
LGSATRLRFTHGVRAPTRFQPLCPRKAVISHISRRQSNQTPRYPTASKPLTSNHWHTVPIWYIASCKSARFFRLPSVALAKEGAPRTMPARRAVLLTPSKSLGPTQLLSYQHIAPVTPLKSALTRHSQITENTATLSLAESALTDISLATPLESALTKTPGGTPRFCYHPAARPTEAL